MEVKDMLVMILFLMVVIMGGGESVKVLLDYGVVIIVIDFLLNSCLYLVVMYERVEIVKVFLERDMDKVLIQLKDKDLRSVFYVVVGLENLEVKFYIYCFLFDIIVWF